MKAKATRTLRSRVIGVLLAVLMLLVSIPSAVKTSAFPGFGGWFGPIVLTNASVEFKDSRFQSISEVDSGSLFYLMATIAGNNVHQRPGANNTYRVYITDNNLQLPNFAGNGFVDGATYNGYTLHNKNGTRYIEFDIANGETKAIRLQAKFANGTTPDDTNSVVKLVQVSTGKSISNTIKANSSIQWSASKAEDRTQLKAADVANGTTVNYSLNASPSNPTSKTGAWWLEGLEYSDTITLTNATFASAANSAIEKTVENMLQNSGYKYDSVSVTVNGGTADISFKVYSKNTTAEMTAPSLTLPLPVNNNTIVLQDGKNAVLNNSLSVIGKPIGKDGFTEKIGGNDVSLDIEAPQGPKFSISKTVADSQLIYSGSVSTKVSYTITVNNYGDAPGDITVEDIPKTNGLTVEGESTYTFKDVKPGEPQSITVDCTLNETTLDYIGNIASVCNRAQDASDNSNYSDAYITVEKATSNLNAGKSGYVTGDGGNQKQTFSAGDKVTYIINVSNNGKADATNVSFSDTIDSNITNVEVKCESENTLAVSENTVSGNINSIPSYGSVVIIITGTVKDDTIASTISNKAQVDGKDTNTVVFTQDSASISASKSGYVGEPGNLFYTGEKDEEAVYTITVKNDGEADAKDVKIYDYLPSGFIASSYQINDGEELTFTDVVFNTTVNIPKKSVVTITIKGIILKSYLDSVEASSKEIQNTATITYNGQSMDTGTVSFSKASGNIGMYKTVEPDNFIEGTETDVTWKIYVSNTGAANAENVDVTDNVPKGATFKSYSIESNQVGSANIKSDTAIDGDLKLTLTSLAKGEIVTIIINGTVSGTEPVTNRASWSWNGNGYESTAISNVTENPNKYKVEKWVVDAQGNTLVDAEGKTQNGFEGFAIGDTVTYRAKFTNNSGSVIDNLYVMDYATGQNLLLEEIKILDEDGKVVKTVPYVDVAGNDNDFSKGWYYDNTGDSSSIIENGMTTGNYPKWKYALHNLSLDSGKSITLEYQTKVSQKAPYGTDLDIAGPVNMVGFDLNESKGAVEQYTKWTYIEIPINASFSTGKTVDTSEVSTSDYTLDELKGKTFNYTITLKPDSDDKTDYYNKTFTIKDIFPDGMYLIDGSVKSTYLKDGLQPTDVNFKIAAQTGENELTISFDMPISFNNDFTITYQTKLTPAKANELYETGNALVELTNTVDSVIITDEDGTVKETKPNATATTAFKKVLPAPGFAKIAHASFAGTVYDEELLQPVEDGFITAGDTLIWRTVVYNGNGDEKEYNSDNTAKLKGYTITDTLPDSYSYDANNITGFPSSIKICQIGSDGKPGDVIGNNLAFVKPTANGKNYTWDLSGDIYALDPNTCLVIEFATIADVAIEGVVTNTGYAKITQPFTVENTVAGEKKDDTIHSYANYNIAGLTTESWKTIHYENEGHSVANGGLHDDPITDTGEGRNPLHNYVQGMQGEKVTYTINVKNNSPVDLENMSIIDRLPYEGDMGLVSGYERNSAFGVKMGEIESVKIDGTDVPYTISYSNNKTAVLNEHSKDWIGQNDAMTWKNDASDDAVNFRVMIDSGILVKTGQTVTITFTGYVPAYVANTGEENIAWNSFAYSYQNSEVLPGTVMVAEPAKVGVWVETPNATNSIKIDKTIEGTTGGTYYFALFDNENNRVSDVVSMTLDADATNGTVSMDNMDFNQINNGNAIFIWETDAKGNILGEQVTSPYYVHYSTRNIDTSKESQTIKVINTLNVGDITVTKNMIANTAKTDTFYFALFTKNDDGNLVRYENAAVQSLTLNAELNDDETAYEKSGTVSFKGVPEKIHFYVLETNENGVLTNTDITAYTYTSVNGNSYTVKQTSDYVQAGGSTTITNTENAVYSITVAKVLSSDDIKTTPKFSVGLFTKDDDSYTQVGDTKEVVSGSEVKFEELDPYTTYYVFELDADGKRLNAGDALNMTDVALSTEKDKATGIIPTADKNFIVSYEGCGSTAIQFANAADSSKSVVITNTDTPENEDLKKITVTKSVMDENGLMSEYTGTFYVGLYTYEVNSDGEEEYNFVKAEELSVTNGTGSVEFTGLYLDKVYVVYELDSKSAIDSPYMEGAVIKSGDDNFVVSYPGGTQAILEPGVPGTLRITNTNAEKPVLSFIKNDVNGDPYTGAHMTLTNGTFTEEWDTEAEPHTIKDLSDGTYTLTETPIPGYAPMNVEVVIKDGYFDTTAMNDESYVVNSVSLTVFNRSVLNVSKVDLNDETTELAGAKIQIILNDADTFLSGVKVSRDGTALNRVPEFSEDNAENGYNEYILENKTLVFFSDGSNNTVITGLPDGSYTMTEEIAPDGYTLAESYNFTIDDGKINAQTSESYDFTSANSTVENKIIMKDSIEKFISISKQDIADSSELFGATLSIIFDGKDDIDAFSIKLTRASEKFEDYTIEGKTITFTSGNAPTKIHGLPNGSYTLHEEAAPDGYQIATDFKFEIKDGEITTITDRDDITVSASELIVKDSASEVKIDKRDVTGKVEVEGATLKLTVKELANGAIIDWAKVSENAVLEVKAVNEGTEGSQNGIQWTSGADKQIIKYLPDGTYVLKEIGIEFEFNSITYAIIETTAEFTIKDGKVLTNDEGMIDGMESDYPGEGAETGAYVYDNGTIVVCDAKSMAKSVSVNISKRDIGGEEVPGASLRVYFVDEDGNEQNVDEWISGEEARVIENLTPDKTYILEEVGAPNGYAYAESIEFSVDSKGNITSSKEDTVDESGILVMIDKAIADIVISKQDITSKKEIKGAKLELREISTDAESNEISEIIESWTSGEDGENEDSTLKSHTISGNSLKAGAKYELVETGAPNGYAYADSIKFTIDKDGNVVIEEKYLSENGEIVMSDAAIEEIKIGKRDITGQEKVEGATLQILDEENNVIEQWTSAEDNHLVDVTKLSAGKTYILHEEGAPDGYIYAADIEFTVNNDGTVTVDKEYIDKDGTIIMKDDVTKVAISKIDATTGEEIEGAKLKLYQITDKNGSALDEEILVDEWTSGDDGKNEDGTIKPHTINGKLIAGAEYRLVEITAPNGYQLTEDVTFKVPTDGSIEPVEMKDSPKGVIAISKQEINGTEELEGATLQILDENGEIVEEWISGSDTVTVTDENGNTIEKKIAHSVKLGEGNYTLKEITAPKGYLVAEEMNFSVSKDGTAIVNGEEKGTIVMLDDYTKVRISKVDITGDKEIPGASLELRDSDGKLIDKWVSDGTPHEIDKLAPGEYTLHEEAAPDGYAYSEDKTFEVTETSEIQNVTMEDKALEVTLNKRALTGDDELPGAELELYQVITDDEGTETRVLIDSWVSETTAHTINIDSITSTGNKIIAGGKYVMVEKRAPHGYQIAEEITFTIEKDGKVVGNTTMFDAETNQLGIRKIDILGDEVIGAHLQIFDSEGALIEEWDSTSTPHIVKLEEGIYTLKEETAPHGYLVTTEITFAVDANGNATVDGKETKGLITMTDDVSTVSIVKIGKNGEEVSEISGADMKLTYTGDGNLDFVVAENGTIIKDGDVITWTSGDTAVKLQRIPNGSYVLEETQAPDGYEVATQITFDVIDGKVINVTVDEESKSTYSNGIISMFDELKPIETEETTTTTTTEDTTTTTASTAGPTNTTTTTTTTTTTGTTASTSGPTNTTTTTTNTTSTTITKPVQTTTTSTAATTTSTMTIISDTSETIDTGDILDSTTTTTTTTTTSTTTTVTTEATQQVQIAKREIAGGYITGAEVIGAYLKVTADDATVIDSWVSDGTFHMISALKEGITYTLSETAPPNGYYYAASIQFTVLDGDVYIVNRDGSLSPVIDGTIIMYDEAIVDQTEPIITTTVTVPTEYTDTSDSSETSETVYTEETTTETVTYDIDISKQEIVNDAITGREVPGAMLQISTAEGIIAQWISGYEPYRIYGLLEDVVYTLTEVQSPDDYELAESIDFVISGGVVYVNGQPTGNTVVMYDRYAPVVATTTTETITTEETTTTTNTTTSTTEETTTSTTNTTITNITTSTDGTSTTTTRYTTTTTRKNNTSNGGGGGYVNVSGSPKTQDSMMSVAGMGGAALVLTIVAGMIRRKKK